MKKKNPFFSIILPTYNRKKLLRRALKSILAQSYQKWEVIITDDGSKKESLTRVLDIIKRFPRISYYYHTNYGVGKSTNLAVKMARGEFVTFLGDDDEYMPNHLAIRYKIIKSQKNIQFIHGGVKVIGNQYVPDRYKPGKKIHISKVVTGGTFVIKKSLFDNLGGFPEKNFGNDTDFFQKVIKAKVRIYKCDKETYIYNRHRASMTYRELKAQSTL